MAIESWLAEAEQRTEQVSNPQEKASLKVQIAKIGGEIIRLNSQLPELAEGTSPDEYRYVSINTDTGPIEVRTSPEVNEIPHLTVTMQGFGRFNVTHIPTGRSVVTNFERAINAQICMTRLQLAFDELGIDLDCDQEQMTAQVKGNLKPCDCLHGETIPQYISEFSSMFYREFPGGCDDYDPYEEYEALLNKLKGAAS